MREITFEDHTLLPCRERLDRRGSQETEGVVPGQAGGEASLSDSSGNADGDRDVMTVEPPRAADGLMGG